MMKITFFQKKKKFFFLIIKICQKLIKNQKLIRMCKNLKCNFNVHTIEFKFDSLAAKKKKKLNFFR